jgi:hypothetical protein
MPALNAARTALICPRVNDTVSASVCRPFPPRWIGKRRARMAQRKPLRRRDF